MNLYGPSARLGLHQDGEEPSDAPVVTISLGDTCVFRMAGVDRRTAPFTDVDATSSLAGTRALRVVVGGGRTGIKLCDPNLPSTDPQACP